MGSPAPFIDHTLLKPTATAAGIAALCEEAVEFGFAAVCVPPFFVRQASDRVYGSPVHVATVVGFPLGYDLPAVKRFQTEQALAAGADEIDMVINLAAASEGNLSLVQEDIAAVVAAAGTVPVKVIIECCLFDDPGKRALADTAVRAGAAFVKTSTGFAASGARVADVRLLVETAAGRAGVKAAGGIRDWSACRAMIEAGASRIGTSAGVAIVRQWFEGREG